MSDKMVGLFALCAGLLLLALRRRFGHFVVREQQRFWKVHFSERAQVAATVVSTVVGVGFFIVGGLALIGLISFQ